jgi:hypothetical protein
MRKALERRSFLVKKRLVNKNGGHLKEKVQIPMNLVKKER